MNIEKIQEATQEIFKDDFLCWTQEYKDKIKADDMLFKRHWVTYKLLSKAINKTLREMPTPELSDVTNALKLIMVDGIVRTNEKRD